LLLILPFDAVASTVAATSLAETAASSPAIYPVVGVATPDYCK